MAQPLVISVDAMGGDHGPDVVVPALDLALTAHPNVRFIVHGDEARIAPWLDKHPRLKPVVTVAHTDNFIAMDEKPAQAVRRGRGTSLYNALQSVKSGDAQAAVSAGNTGALMALSRMILKMAAPGLERPAIAASWPTERGITTVLDVGANVSCDAGQLLEFAIMGAAFHRALRGVDKPSIGLLNVGSEDVKGHEDVREAHALLRGTNLGLNYQGFVEGDDLCKGTVDVVVTDGFTGNIALKTAEGTARFIKGLMKESLLSSLRAKLGAMLAAPALRSMAAKIDPSAINGGPLLGLNGIVIKSHGGTDVRGFATAVGVAINLAASSYTDDIKASMAHLLQVINEGPVIEADFDDDDAETDED